MEKDLKTDIVDIVNADDTVIGQKREMVRMIEENNLEKIEIKEERMDGATEDCCLRL